ncbi:MAG: hypothetical protein ABI592_07435 [Acidobacteriota bacterium]
MNSGPPVGLDEARRRLKELGYLDGGVERWVFSRAFEGRGGLLVPAAVLGAFAAALAAVSAVAAADPEFLVRPAAPAALLLHLFPAFLLPAAALAFAVGLLADRSRSPATGAAACAAASAAGIFFLWIAGAYRLTRDLPPASLLWGLPVALAALLAARSVRSGYLARAYARTHALPAARGRGLLFGIAVAALLVAAAVFASRPAAAVAPPMHVSPRTERILVVALDGLPAEGAGGAETRRMRELLSAGATGWWAQEKSAPPELWTTIATGMPAARHGVRALERVRPRGSPSALRAPLGTAWYLRALGPALGLVTSAPVSAADRRALSIWEVAASAGVPSAAVGWWASGPWPGATVVDNRDVLSRAAGGEEGDRIAIDELQKLSAAGIVCLYLPGPDILRNEPDRRDREIGRVRLFLEREAGRARSGGTVLVVLAADSHGPAGAQAAATVFDGRAPAVVRIRPVDVAPSILARAGIPAASDLPGRPVPALFREGSLETLTVPTYGARSEPQAARSPTSDREYLKKLKSLGYLN